MVNTNPLYTAPEMAHQFTDSGAVGLIVIDLFAPKVAEVLPKTSIAPWSWSAIADLLPPLKRLAGPRGAEVREEDGAADHVRRTPRFDARAGAGRRSHRRRRRSAASTRRRWTTTASPRCNTPAARPAWPRAPCSRTATCSPTSIQGLEVWKPFLRLGDEVMLTALPLYHIFAFTANLMIFFVAGGRNMLVPSPRPLSNLKKVMTTEPITWFTGVNTLFAG